MNSAEESEAGDDGEDRDGERLRAPRQPFAERRDGRRRRRADAGHGRRLVDRLSHGRSAYAAQEVEPITPSTR